MQELYKKFTEIATKEIGKFIVDIRIISSRESKGSVKLRCYLKDSSFIDIYVSQSGKFSFHLERRMVDGIFYRVDNAPDHPEIETFPYHLHSGNEENIQKFKKGKDIYEDFRNFLRLVKKRL